MDEKAQRIMEKMFGGTPYTFHRSDGFYPLALRSDEEAVANAKCNPGTTKVVNEFTGQQIWPNNEQN